MKHNKKVVRAVCFVVAAVMIATMFSSVVFSLASLA